MNEGVAESQAAIDQLCINTIRTLSMDAVQKANSGHPGAPMGLAPAGYMLWTAGSIGIALCFPPGMLPC